jgi:hypothetical protein
MSKYLTTGSNEIEADIIMSRLSEAGIHAWQQGALGGRPGYAGPRDIYVEEADLEAARDALRAAQDVDENELIALSEGRTQETTPAKGTPVEIPVPKRKDWETVLRRSTRARAVQDEAGDNQQQTGDK